MTWLSVKEVAELLSITERAVQISKTKYEYRHVKGVGRGGKQIEIRLESLPQEAQDKYNHIERERKSILHFTAKQREDANAKAWIVEQYWRSRLSPEEFIEEYNAENPDEPLSRAQLFRWQSRYKKDDVAGLIDQRGKYRKGSSGIEQDAWDYFYCLYMTQQKLSVQRCYELTRWEYPDIPSVSTFQRKVRKIPQLALIAYREGKHALQDALPSMQRSRLDIQSNDIWFSDHHLMDVFVTNKSGKAKRLWLTVFFDARSNKVVSILARDADPNATAVKQCFRLGAEEHGVPNEVYFDNGRDYRSKSFRTDYPLSLVNQLGIGTIYATKYHGQAKTVERFFGTLEDRFGRLFKTYAGSDAKKRPEQMRISNEKIAQMAPTMGEFTAALEAYIDEYNNTPSRGIDMDYKSPNQVYQENLLVKRRISDPEALALLCGSSEVRTVHKNGVTIRNNTYRSEYLYPHLGEKVIVTFTPENIDKVSIFDMEGSAICVAYAQKVTPFRATTEEDYIAAVKQKKAARAVAKQHKPAREFSISELIAKKQLEEKVFAESGDTVQVEQLTVRATRNREQLRATEQRSHRIKDEDSITAALHQKYKQA